MGGQNGKEPQCEYTEGSTVAEAQRTEHSQSGTAPHTRDGVDNTKDRKLECGDTAELTDAGYRKLECGHKVNITDEQAKEPVWCPEHGDQNVVKKDQK